MRLNLASTSPERPHRLAQHVVEQLVDQIVTGEWPPEQLVPTEGSLMDAFGVSRAVLREAIKELEGMRLLRVRQGHGTTVRAVPEWDLMHPSVLAACVQHDEEQAFLDDVVDVRRALESQMAGQAALRHGEHFRERITHRWQALAQVEGDPTEFVLRDFDFHDVIHDAAGNRLARAAIRTLTQEARRSVRYMGEPDAAECRRSNEEHRAIMEAVLARDPGLAADLMNAHIQDAWRRRRP